MAEQISLNRSPNAAALNQDTRGQTPFIAFGLFPFA
jgi:hypothetical protein